MSINAPPGEAFGSEDIPSNARLNRKTRVVGTGSYLTNLSPKYPGQSGFCTQAGGGLNADTAYDVAADGTRWKVSGLGRHLHTGDNDAEGGLARDIILANLENIFWLPKPTITSGQLIATNSGGTIADDGGWGAVVFNSSNTPGNWAEARETGTRFDFGAGLKMIFKCFIDSNTYTTARIGTGMEAMGQSNDTNRKLGFEICDTLGSARNWEVTSSDGLLRSTTTSSKSANRSSEMGYKLVYTPFQTLQFYVGGILDVTKNTNIPNSGSSMQANVLRFGIKTNNNTEKHMYIFGYSMIGKTGDGEAWS